MTGPQREQAVQKYLDAVKNEIDQWIALHPDDADQALLELTEYTAERRFEAQDAAARAVQDNTVGQPPRRTRR